jgi:hypothetical protein
MKAIISKSRRTGVAMIEAVISIGVLAVAVPLVFAALAEGGKSAAAARVDTFSAWIVPACMEEIHASRAGRPRFFSATAAGEPLPPAGEIWALAFAVDGHPVSRLPQAEYDHGTATHDGMAIRYIATIRSSPVTPSPGGPALRRVEITLEHPAAAPATKRGKSAFLTLVP